MKTLAVAAALFVLGCSGDSAAPPDAAADASAVPDAPLADSAVDAHVDATSDAAAQCPANRDYYSIGNPQSGDLPIIAASGSTATSGSFNWDSIEAKQGTYDWSGPDNAVAQVLAAKLAVASAYIGSTPAWAHPSTSSLPSYRAPPDDAYASNLQAFCQATAARYKGKVERFSFWNEPNGCSWVNDNCSNGSGYALYVKWLKVCYAGIKAGNPNAKVAGGSLDANASVDVGPYVQGMYASGAKGYMDAIALHPYAPSGIHWAAIDTTRQIMVAQGDGSSEIWINEYGWPDSQGTTHVQELKDTFAKLQTSAYSFVTEVQYLTLEDLSNGTYGLCAQGPGACRPLYSALQDVIKAACP